MIKEILFRPLSALYALAIKMRTELYRLGVFATYRSTIPVVCVGNVAVGGNGKTPLVLKLAEQLIKKQQRVVILCRGYKGSRKEPGLVTNEDNTKLVGDEAKLLSVANLCPVVTAANRVAGVKYIENNFECDCIVMDDGFQHLALDKAATILAFDASNAESVAKTNADCLLPVGRHREYLRTALMRADYIVLNSRSLGEPQESYDFLKQNHLPVFYSKIEDYQLIHFNQQQDPLKEAAEVQLLSAIANVHAFEETVQAMGFKVRERYFYPDHYQFTEGDLRKLDTTFPVICTKKDYVKLTELRYDFSGFNYLDIQLKIWSVKEDQQLADLIIKKIRH